MKTRLAVILASALFLTLAFLLVLPGAAQRGGGQRGGGQRGGSPSRQSNTPRANQGHPPPAPPARSNQSEQRQPERLPTGHTNDTPHVNHDTWYGHEQGNDARFHLDHPFDHGHFTRFGPSYRYGVTRFDLNLHRFWFNGGFYFQVADWDWPLAADWCWNCGDDFTVYEDPDHPGWYLLYNVHTGGYVHVQYMGT
jgi:hypothetical protein